jgi:hypothetical protein
MFCQILINSQQKRHVIAWWRSRETFVEAWGKQFAKLLGTNAEPCFQGFQRSQRVGGEPSGRLKPAAIVAAVGGLVALLTGLSTIQDFGYALLAIPDCTLWADQTAAGKPHGVGDTFEIPIQVKNRHLHASGTATLEPLLGDDALTGLKRVGNDSGASDVRVEPGKFETQAFHFAAVRSGSYTINFGGIQRAGWAYYYWPRKLLSFPVKIEVWDSIDQAPKLSLVKSTDRSATVSVEVRNARATPYGTAFEATLTNPGDVEVRADGLTIKDADGPPNNADFALLNWRAPPSTDTLTVQTFRLVLQGSGAKARSVSDWNALLQRMSVRVDEPD